MNIFDSEGKLIGYTDHSLSCYGYCQILGTKYEPDFGLRMVRAMTGRDDFGKVLEETFRDAEPHDTLASRIFLDDNIELSEEDILYLERAIEEYPANLKEKPKKLMEQYLSLLKQHKKIRIEFNCVVSGFRVVEKEPED